MKNLSFNKLKKIIMESLISESNFKSIDDALKFVKKIKPNMTPDEQEKFAKNIMAKQDREAATDKHEPDKPEREKNDMDKFLTSQKGDVWEYLYQPKARYVKDLEDHGESLKDVFFYKPIKFGENEDEVELELYEGIFDHQTSQDDGDYDDGQLGSWTDVTLYYVPSPKPSKTVTGKVKDGRIWIDGEEYALGIIANKSNTNHISFRANEHWEEAPRRGSKWSGNYYGGSRRSRYY